MTRAAKIAAARDGMVCRRCGRMLSAMSLHHRLPRGMGGSGAVAGLDRSDRPSNLIRLCGTGTTGCHGWVESHREKAYATGWLVHRWDNPAEVAMIDSFGRRLMIDDAGNIKIEQVVL